jgi:hypothetical protein
MLPVSWELTAADCSWWQLHLLGAAGPPRLSRGFLGAASNTAIVIELALL